MEKCCESCLLMLPTSSCKTHNCTCHSNENISTDTIGERLRELGLCGGDYKVVFDFTRQEISLALQRRNEEHEIRRKGFSAFLEGYKEGVVEDPSTTKEVKLAKLSVLKDVKEFYK